MKRYEARNSLPCMTKLERLNAVGAVRVENDVVVPYFSLAYATTSVLDRSSG
jgi:hypothetical protein